MNSKLESIERRVRRRGGSGGGDDLLETLAQESFDILTLLPTYIEGAKDAVNEMARESGVGLTGGCSLMTPFYTSTYSHDAITGQAGEPGESPGG